MNWFESAKELLAKWKAGGLASNGRWGRFTPRAQQSVRLAAEEARKLNHNFIGTEHVLLGLIKLNQGVAFNVLKQFGVDFEKAHTEVEKLVGAGSESLKNFSIPFTPRTRRVLDLAEKEAAQLKHTYVGPEHILLALLQEDGVAQKVFKNFGVDIKKLKKEILNELTPNFDLGNSEQNK
jgi:ATP-dependent Clp protease ATP-binding subunit ClpC